MPVTRTLAALGRLFRRTPPPPDDILEAYAHEVVPVLDRAEWLYQYWLEQSTLFSDSEKLGNVAAIHRWETASMGRSLERVRPPTVLTGAHEDVLDALDMASRAAQLLSSGSRFHNANAVCEGQSLLVASRDRRLSALSAMRRYLAAVIDADAAANAAGAQAALGMDGPPRPSSVAAADAGGGVVGTGVIAAGVAAGTAIGDPVAADVMAADVAEIPTTASPPTSLPALTNGVSDAVAAFSQAAWPTGAEQAFADHDDASAIADYDTEFDDDFEHEAHDLGHDDDDEDALPWLTRLAQQTAEAQVPPVPAPPPVAAPSSPTPTPTPPAPQPSVTPAPPRGGGWGSLFGRSQAPADPDA